MGNETTPSQLVCSSDESTSSTASTLGRDDKGFRRVIRNFTPSWFAATMGTGIVSILLKSLPYESDALFWISVVVFCFNILLFFTFTFISVLRYILYPEVWGAMIRHPVQSLFLGTVPMGFATIVNMTTLVCVPHWGPWVVPFVWTLWWIDVVLSIGTCFCIPFVMMNWHESSIKTMTAAWLLPVVSTVVASASGGVVADVLPPHHAVLTIVVSYILWGTGVPFAFMIMAIYYQRLTMHSIPPREVIVSVFLPLGPLGQGGFGILQLGKVALKVMPQTSSLVPEAGQILLSVGFLIATIMWGFGLLWLFFAISSILLAKFPFNLSWWGFTFPLGVFTTSALLIGKELPSKAFDIIGTILTGIVIILWIVVAFKTMRRVITGEIFVAPCLANLKPKVSV